MAHTSLRRLLFCKRTAIISAAKGTPLQTQGLPDVCPLPCENGGQQAAFFWHLHVLPSIRDLPYLIRNSRLLIEQIQATVFSNRFALIAHGQRAGGC